MPEVSCLCLRCLQTLSTDWQNITVAMVDTVSIVVLLTYQLIRGGGTAVVNSAGYRVLFRSGAECAALCLVELHEPCRQLQEFAVICCSLAREHV